MKVIGLFALLGIVISLSVVGIMMLGQSEGGVAGGIFAAATVLSLFGYIVSHSWRG